MSDLRFPEHPAESDWVSVPGERLRILEPIKTGSKAELLLVERRRPGGFRRKLVLKRLLSSLSGKSKRFIAMIVEEGKICANIDHPNVVRVEDLWVQDNNVGILMEHLEGESVATLMKRKRPRLRDPIFVASLLEQICEGLNHAHNLRHQNGMRLDLVHGGITPTNLFLTRHGVAKVLDFGLAESITKSAESKGRRLSYSSPEQIKKQRLDARSDIFSLAVIGYELLTGKRLFKRPSAFLTMQSIVHNVVPPLRQFRGDLPQSLEAVFDKALQAKPEDRFSSAREFGMALSDAMKPLGGIRRPSALLPRVNQLLRMDTGTDTDIVSIAPSPFDAPREKTLTQVFSMCDSVGVG